MIEQQYYIKTLMNQYLRETSHPLPTPIRHQPITNYLIYNFETHSFNSSHKLPEILQTQTERFQFLEILNDEEEFYVFICDSIDTEYSFIELISNVEAENKIYEYYEFYDINRDSVIVSYDNSQFIDCECKLFNSTTTEYYSKSDLDSFRIVHFVRYE